MSNKNEKAQSAEELTPAQIEGRRIYPDWYTEYDEGRAYKGFLRGTHFQMERMGEHFVTIGELESRISQLESDLAKSQEKCKALEFNLLNTAVYWHAIENDSIPAYLIQLAGGLSDKAKVDFLKTKGLTGFGQIEYTKDRLEVLAEQALKPTEHG